MELYGYSYSQSIGGRIRGRRKTAWRRTRRVLVYLVRGVAHVQASSIHRRVSPLTKLTAPINSPYGAISEACSTAAVVVALASKLVPSCRTSRTPRSSNGARWSIVVGGRSPSSRFPFPAQRTLRGIHFAETTRSFIVYRRPYRLAKIVYLFQHILYIDYI